MAAILMVLMISLHSLNHDAYQFITIK